MRTSKRRKTEENVESSRCQCTGRARQRKIGRKSSRRHLRKSSPCIFYHEQRDIRTFAHGDDYVSSGSPDNIQWLKNMLSKKYAIKTTIIGEDEKYAKEVRIQNRIVRWHPGEGVTIEADPRHAQLLIRNTGVENKKVVTTPGTKVVEDHEQEERHGGEGLLDARRTTAYRANVARANYLAADRGDILYTVKELA